MTHVAEFMVLGIFSSMMVYSHWLGPEPGPGQGLGQYHAEPFTLHRDLEEWVVWF